VDIAVMRPNCRLDDSVTVSGDELFVTFKISALEQ